MKTIRLLGGPANGSTVTIPALNPPVLRVPFYGSPENPGSFSIEVGGYISRDAPLNAPPARVCEYVPAGLPLCPDVWAPREFVRQDVTKALGSLAIRTAGMARGVALKAWPAHDDRLVTTTYEVTRFAEKVAAEGAKVGEVRALDAVVKSARRDLGIEPTSVAPVVPLPLVTAKPERPLDEWTVLLIDRLVDAARRVGPESVDEARSVLVRYLAATRR